MLEAKVDKIRTRRFIRFTEKHRIVDIVFLRVLGNFNHVLLIVSATLR